MAENRLLQVASMRDRCTSCGSDSGRSIEEYHRRRTGDVQAGRGADTNDCDETLFWLLP